jgi:hypothetical protein
MDAVTSGRAARRAHARSLKLRGPGYTRAMRPGRTKRRVTIDEPETISSGDSGETRTVAATA